MQGELEHALLLSQSASHEPDHRDVDDGLAGGREVFVVLTETALAPKPPEGALDNPPSREHLESFDVVAAFDDLHFQPVPNPQIAHPNKQLPGIATVGPNQPQAREGVSKHRQNQARSVAVLDIGRMDDGNKHQPENIYQQMAFAAIDLLARIVAVRAPLSVVLTDWLSMMAALG